MVATRRGVGAYRWELAMVAVTAVWGSTFVLVRDAVAQIPPFTFIAYRFQAAALLLTAIRPRLALGWSGADSRPGGDGGPGTAGGGRLGPLAAGAVIGAVLVAGYGFQTVGLQYTTASNAGFITGLSVVLTPLLGALLLRQAPGRWPVTGACVAAVGLALLSLQRLEVRQGDALVFACAVAFATHILLLGRYAPRLSTYRLAVVQLATAGLLALIWAALAGDLAVPASAEVWVALAITSVAASAGAFLIQTRAQREVSPTRTAVIFAMEPVFAGLFGFLLAGERLSGRGWLGAGLILAGMLTAELGGRADGAGRGRPVVYFKRKGWL